jgi:hypothetical protein
VHGASIGGGAGGGDDAPPPSSPSYEVVGIVHKGGTQEWVEARASLLARPDISHLRLTDLDQSSRQSSRQGGVGAQQGLLGGGGGGGGGDDSQSHDDDSQSHDDDTFAWVEVSKVPFAYNFTARFVNLTRE